ncbi:MAG: YheV family putative metal-binding protein [Alteromonadaceae bacterium]|nr:YheV family putative metal-binding protein [Alteromonadaceae bacterium]
MKKTTKKRFIASAICPKCKKMDTLALTKELGVEKVTCVSCGDQMSQPEEHVAKEIRAEEQVIGIFKP